jgi:hypothetical protein
MATTLTTTNFRIHAAEQLFASLNNGTTYYVFAGQPESWPDDSNPPLPEDSINGSVFSVWDNMVFGKQVTSSDVSFMVPLYPWTTNTVFSMYDDQDPNLMTEEFFVTVDANTEYYVFKCLNNNGGVPSTIAPDFNNTSADDTYYQTSDGYQWKYMFTVDSTVYDQFATTSWVPVVVDANVSGNAVSGAIDTILVENGGINYNSYANGYFSEFAVNGDGLIYGISLTGSSNTDFYSGCALKIIYGTGAGQQRNITDYEVQGGFKRVYLDQPFVNIPDNTSYYEITPSVTINGDGTGCVARAIVNTSSNTISSIEISARGQDYTYANAAVVGNTGVILTGNSVVQANTASLRVIMGPPGGHGANTLVELGATSLGFAVTFANNESLTIPTDGQFRQFGLIKDPLWANVALTLSNITGEFLVGETISNPAIPSQTALVSSYNSTVSLLGATNVHGGFVANASIVGANSGATATVTSYTINGAEKSYVTFDERMRLGTTFNGTSPFIPGQVVNQLSTNGTGVVFDSNTSFTSLTQIRGTIDITDPSATDFLVSNTAVANVTAIVSPDLIKQSGETLYIENIPPVTRAPTLSETVQFIIGF